MEVEKIVLLETDHRNILRHPDLQRLDGKQSCKTQRARRQNHCLHVTLQSLIKDTGHVIIEIEVIHIVYLNAVLKTVHMHRLDISLDPVLHGRQTEGIGDNLYVVVAVMEKVIHNHLSRLHIIEHHTSHIHSRQVAVYDDGRYACRQGTLHRMPGILARSQDQAFDAACDICVENVLELLKRFVMTCKLDDIALVARHVLYTSGYIGKEAVGDVGHAHAYSVRTAAPEACRRLVRTVSEPSDHFLNPFCCLRAHAAVKRAVRSLLSIEH